MQSYTTAAAALMFHPNLYIFNFSDLSSFFTLFSSKVIILSFSFALRIHCYITTAAAASVILKEDKKDEMREKPDESIIEQISSQIWSSNRYFHDMYR